MISTVISLCDRSGIMVQPWLDAGYRAVTYDLQDAVNPHPNRLHIPFDVCNIRSLDEFEPIAAVFAFPPCTDLAISGARWFRSKGISKLIEALQVVEACRLQCESSGARWMIENPIGTLATYWRPPDHAFDPCDYGDPYTKRTCLWVGNGFIMPPKIQPGDMFAPSTWVEPVLGSMISTLPDSRGRTEKREATPIGFARAVFKANHGGAA